MFPFNQNDEGESNNIRDSCASCFYAVGLVSSGYSPHFVKLMLHRTNQTKKELDSVALVCKRTIPTERPPHFGEVSANLCG
jgi:hypothetical protein